MRHSLRAADVFPTFAVRRLGETKAVLGSLSKDVFEGRIGR